MVSIVTPKMLARSGSESANAKALCCWCVQNLDKYPELKWLTHIPNGGWRDERTALNLKAEGVKSGVPDYLLAIKRGEFSGLWIELKRPESVCKNKKGKTIKRKAGKTSNEQDEWKTHLLSQGFGVFVAVGWEDARDCIIAYLEHK